MKTQFLLIPDFVSNRLNRSSKSLKTILDFNAVSDELSVNDMVRLLEFQSFFKEFLNINIGNDYIGDRYRLSNIWSNGYSKLSEHKQRMLDNVFSQEGALEQNKNDLRSLYFIEQDIKEFENAFEIHDLGSRNDNAYENTYVIGIIIHAGHFPNTEISNSLIKSLIKSAYVYEDISAIASGSLFKIYIDTLK